MNLAGIPKCIFETVANRSADLLIGSLKVTLRFEPLRRSALRLKKKLQTVRPLLFAIFVNRSVVARISNLLYRGFPIRQTKEIPSRWDFAVAQPNGIRRYSRLEICATGSHAKIALQSKSSIRKGPFGRILTPLLLLLVLILLNGCATSPHHAGKKTFRVMTYNIHHGEGLDGKVDLQRIAELIRRERADIVALQEVDKGVARTARRDLPADLSRLTGMACVFSNNFHYQGGEYGNAVLTRFPVVSATNLHYAMLRTNEQRGLLQLTLDVRGHRLVFMTTHIDHRTDDAERLLNVRQIQETTRQYAGQAIILCGDFNDTPGSRTHTKLKELLDDSWELAGQGDGLTFSASQPRKRIDYIWISKNKSLTPINIWVPQSDASDHLPLVAEFGLTVE